MTDEREGRGEKLKSLHSECCLSIQVFPGQKSRANTSPTSIYKTAHGKIYISRFLVDKKLTCQPEALSNT